MVVVLFLDKNLPEKDIDALEEKVKNSTLVIKTQFISSNQALEKFQEKFPDLQGIIENLKINPFPSSFEITLKEESISSDKTSNFINNMKNTPGVEDIQFNKDWIERMKSLSKLVKTIGFFLGGILVLASFFIISNIIKLNVFARQNEIEILRLSGATNSFIRIPFLLEGIILGMIGGILSFILLLLLIEIFPLYLGSSLGVLSDIIKFRYLSFSQVIALLAAGAVIGFLGSLSSLSRFLKT